VFLRVEPIWLSLEPGEDGWQKVAEAVDALFQQHDRVMIESLGAGEGFQAFRAGLASRYAIQMIRVIAAPDTCLDRVRSRNSHEYIPVSDEKVAEYNEIAAQGMYDWAAEIDNNGPATAETILATIRGL
jgi:hypothetical protein